MVRRGHNDGSIFEVFDADGNVPAYGRQVSLPGGGRPSRTFRVSPGPRGQERARREAEKWCRVAVVEAEHGLLAAKRPPTFAAYLTDTWLPGVADRVRPNTLYSYGLCVRRVPEWLGALRLDELRPFHFQRFCDALKGGLAPQTVRQTHAVLHKALEDALPLDLLPRGNPLHGVRLPRVRRPESVFYDEAELARLFDATVNHRFHALWVVFGTYGLRLSEAAGLKWTDVAWGEQGRPGTLSVARTIQRNRLRGKMEEDTTKNDYSLRTLPLLPHVADALRAHRARQLVDRARRADVWQGENLIFCTEYGSPLPLKLAHDEWTKACAAAGLPRLRIHDLRHSVASNLVRAGTDSFRVAKLLGHANPSMVDKRYGHLKADDHHAAANLMENLITRHRTRG